MKKIIFFLLTFIVIPGITAWVTTLSIKTHQISLGLATSRYEQNLLPFVTDRYDLGTSTNMWNRVFANYASTTIISNEGVLYSGTNQGINPCTTFLIGTSTPDPGCAQMVLSKVSNQPSQNGGVYQAIKFQFSNSTTFVPSAACGQFVWNIAFNSFAGAGRDMGAICANYDQPTTSLGGHLRFYTRDHTSGLLTDRGGFDGLGNFGIGTTTRASTTNTPRFYVGGLSSNASPLVVVDSVTAFASTTQLILTSTGLLGLSSSTPFAKIAAEHAGTDFMALKSTDTVIGNGDVVQTLDFYTGDNSGITNRNIAYIRTLADTADFAGVAAPTAIQFGTQTTTGGAPSVKLHIGNNDNNAFGSTTPTANLQITNSASNATTSIQFGKANQNKGTCMTEYDAAGSPVYSYYAAGATTKTVQNGGTAPSGCKN